MSPYARLVLLALGGLISLAVAVGVGRFIYTPILPFMVEDLDLTKGDAGLIASANYVGYFIGALIGTTPLLGGSRRAWLLTSLAVSAVTTMAMGLTSSMVLFLALRLIGGIASALILVFASTLVLERLRASGHGGLASLHFAGVGTGLAVAAAMVSLLVHGGIGWRGHWIIGGALSLIAAAAVAAFVQKEAEPPALPRQQNGTSRYLTLLVTAYGLFGIGYVITATFIMAIVRDNAEIRPLEPYIWILVGLSAAPSVAVWTWIAGRIGIIPAFSAACLGSGRWGRGKRLVDQRAWHHPCRILPRRHDHGPYRARPDRRPGHIRRRSSACLLLNDRVLQHRADCRSDLRRLRPRHDRQLSAAIPDRGRHLDRGRDIIGPFGTGSAWHRLVQRKDLVRPTGLCDSGHALISALFQSPHEFISGVICHAQ